MTIDFTRPSRLEGDPDEIINRRELLESDNINCNGGRRDKQHLRQERLFVK